MDLVAGDGEVFVAGPDTAAWSSVTRPGAVLTGVRFIPGRAAAVLGVAADELRDRRVPVGELWGEVFAERLLTGELSPAQAVAARLREAPPPDPAVAALIDRLDAGAARVGEAVAGLAGARADGEAAAALGGSGASAADIAAALIQATQLDPAAMAAALGRPGASAAEIAAALIQATQLDPNAALSPANPETARATAALIQAAQLDPAAMAVALGGSGASAADITAALAQSAARRAAAAATRVEDPLAVGERRLRRRFVQAVGYGPATYLRVSRFQRAVALAPHLPTLAGLAAAAGYADQAHLSRDCRALTGLTPRAYFRRPSTVDATARDRLRSA